MDQASSSDETLDFDNELASDIDDEECALDESQLLERVRPRQKIDTESLRFSRALSAKSDVDPSRFKVVGYSKVAPTCKPTTITASWIAASTQFSAQITECEELPRLNVVEGISPRLIEELAKFTDVLFPVQQAVFPAFLEATRGVLPPRDFVISAPTGSGKTLCFVVPILNALERVKRDASAIFALIVAPVQNLAQQIYSEFIKYNVNAAQIVLLNGARDYDAERASLFPAEHLNGSSHAHVIVATPARLVEHLLDAKGRVNLSQLRYLIVDEADRLNDTARMEWLDIVERRANAFFTNNLTITDLTRPDINYHLQKVLCSATLSLDLDHLHVWRLRYPRLFKARPQPQSNGRHSRANDDVEMGGDEDEQDVGGHEGAMSEKKKHISLKDLILPANLNQKVILCQTAMKPAMVYLALSTEKEWKKILIFVKQKFEAHKLKILLTQLARKKFIVEEFSSEKYANRRAKCIKQFEAGKIRVLVSTDVLSRGIDMSNVDCVINYNPPINERIFVHRAGRTARGLATGTVLSYVDKPEKMKLKKMLLALNAWRPDILEDRRESDNFINKTLMRKYTKTMEYLQSLKEREQTIELNDE